MYDLKGQTMGPNSYNEETSTCVDYLKVKKKDKSCP